MCKETPNFLLHTYGKNYVYLWKETSLRLWKHGDCFLEAGGGEGIKNREIIEFVLTRIPRENILQSCWFAKDTSVYLIYFSIIVLFEALFHFGLAFKKEKLFYTLVCDVKQIAQAAAVLPKVL